jgi:NAD(P)-dependent dehydrogenase (short-subunit alcohol dehydrogenase family)
MKKRLEGKRAVVTGAASGIGRASAVLFAQNGAQVLASDIERAGLDETVQEIRREGGTAEAVVADAGKPADVQGLVDRCAAHFGGLEVFYANAGVSGGLVPLLGLEIEEWTRLLGVNLLGPFLGVQRAASYMVDHGGGSIVCTASVAGLRAGAGSPHYSASKAAVINLVQLAATQLAGTGVRVNAICPGLIETGMTRPLFDAARAAGKEQKIGQLNPLRRAGRPPEVAHVALFLASDDSSYVNGQAIVVDGGLSASLPFVPGRMV